MNKGCSVSDRPEEPVSDRLVSGLPAAPPDRLTLAFGGYGEPTVHPGFLGMVERARRDLRRVELITNGTTMTTQLAHSWPNWAWRK